MNVRAIYVAFLCAAVSFACAGATGGHGDLLALYTFNGTLKDASGSGNDAKATGTPRYAAGAPFGGKAIVFDGTGKVVVTAPLDLSPQALNQVTFGAWVKARSVATPQYGIISIDDGNYDRTLDIDTRCMRGAHAWCAFVGGGLAGKVTAEAGAWVFLAVSYDQSAGPGEYAFYVKDGPVMSVATGADAFDDNSVTTGVTIGRNPNFDHPFDGEIANAFFYRGILTRDQIEAIAAKGPSAIPR